MRGLFLFLVSLLFLLSPFIVFADLDNGSMTAESLRKHYRDGAFKVVIVPGHDLLHWGTQFGTYKEAQISLRLAYELKRFLTKDKKIHVQVSRGEDGSYASWLTEYIEDHGKEVLSFRTDRRATMHEAIQRGTVIPVSNVGHNSADSDTATYLFALNKYANDNGVDLVLHLHADDYAGRKGAEIGKYTGFTIFTPEKQFANAPISKLIANSLLSKIGTVLGQSTLPTESGGVVEDQELIAIGANGTRDGASVLVEYGYIYEPHFRFPSIRQSMITELAYQTSEGIIGFLDPNATVKQTTTLVPVRFDKLTLKGMTGSLAVLGLQAALKKAGFFPPYPLTLTDCPLSGSFGDCTEDALVNFQQKVLGYNTSSLGPATRTALKRYSK